MIVWYMSLFLWICLIVLMMRKLKYTSFRDSDIFSLNVLIWSGYSFLTEVSYIRLVCLQGIKAVPDQSYMSVDCWISSRALTFTAELCSRPRSPKFTGLTRLFTSPYWRTEAASCLDNSNNLAYIKNSRDSLLIDF